MKKTLFLAVIILCAAGAAVAYDGPRYYESIEDFGVNIAVNTDSSVDITEIIVYNSGKFEKHGIFRKIRLQSSDNSGLGISGISITDEEGRNYKYTTTRQPGYVIYRIGDPDSTFVGGKTYFIKYRIQGALGEFDGYDEIYWNVTGNNWPFDIENTEVSVTLPAGAKIIQTAGYYGPAGSKTRCGDDGDGHFYHRKPLAPSEGVTVAVGFTKGIVKFRADPMAMARKILYFAFLVLPIFVFIVMYRYWYRYGRDPKSGRPIIPQYDVPDNLTPLEAAGVVNQRADAREISAEIIYLAVNGHIYIERIEEKVLFIKTEDYILRKGQGSTVLTDAENKLMSGLFGGGSEVKMSSLREEFYVHISGIISSVFERITSAGYYKGNPKKVGMGFVGGGAFMIFASFFLPVTLASNIFAVMTIVLATASMAISGIIMIIFGVLMPVRTDKGLAAREHLLGLKEYLDIAEKDRINFHNAPEKKPEIFEKFLPYAMIFSLEKAWAKEFDGIYTEPSKWYTDRSMSSFGAIAFANSLTNFTNSAAGAMASTPSSSGSGGSGGGGSSGGGGGGGGGGSW